MAKDDIPIVFEKSIEKAHFLSPLREFKQDTHKLEHRRDPLTGKRSILGLRLVEKFKTLIGDTDKEFIDKLVNESASKCFFCPDKVQINTPKFLEDDLPEGRICVGEATLFPNLFPLCEYHALVILSTKHFLRLEEFTQKLLADSFLAVQEFLLKAPNTISLYGTLNCNYLLPAGASAIHPHFQLLLSSFPSNYNEEIESSLKKYYEQYNRIYWDDLVAIEKDLNERYIGSTGEIDWISVFSPRGMNEIMGIGPPGKFDEYPKSTITSLADGISRILRFYGGQGYSSFNLSINFGLLGSKTPWKRNIARIVTRQNLRPGYRSDIYYFQLLLDTEVAFNPPETLAREIQIGFDSL